MVHFTAHCVNRNRFEGNVDHDSSNGPNDKGVSALEEKMKMYIQDSWKMQNEIYK